MFKWNVGNLLLTVGNNSVVARKYEIRPNVNVVSKWVRRYKAGQLMQGSSPKGNATHVTQQEYAQLVLEDGCLSMYEFESYTEAYRAVEAFIRRYNTRRLHSSLHYLSPVEFYRRHLETGLQPKRPVKV